MAGVTNMVLDYLFVGRLGFGIAGAAVGDSMRRIYRRDCSLIFYFARKNLSSETWKTKF
ncbi:MAG: hypothetical protein ACLSGB_14455 [Dorea sp.]